MVQTDLKRIDKMKRPSVSFMGLGHVGLTIAACMASRGFKVLGFDVDPEKVKMVNKAKCPIYEPKLEELIKNSVKRGLLRATTDFKEAILDSDVTFITVGTPSLKTGEIDLRYVKEASKIIGEALSEKDDWHLIVVKSTVIPGTTEGLVKKIVEERSGKRCPEDFGLCMNPEFLREGSAVRDTLNPDRIIIGEIDKRSGDCLEHLYRIFYGDAIPPILRTSPINAELIKYANNAFLAMKVSFINMIANLCQELPGADIEDVAKGIGLDKRIGPLFLKAGVGWGGSCWPKDLAALRTLAKKLGVEMPLIDATIEINTKQPLKLIELAKQLLGDLKGKRISILGLSFKPETDDMRGAVSVKIIEVLLNEGASVIVYDPRAMATAKCILKDKVEYASSVKECLSGSDCALLVTEWEEFKELKPDDFKRLMKNPVVIDGRRIYDAKAFFTKIKFAAIGLGPQKANNEER